MVQTVDFSEEMESAYLNYAMSVIRERALPDVRDGLKPVQRRVLFATNELLARHDKPYRKSARIVGDTMGKYHPHGDSSIYEAMVHLARSFSLNHPLIDGHGNFGSIEGDPAAAMRYTEARLSEYTEISYLQDLDKGIVPMVKNFDGTEEEPVVLPALLPAILVNGSEGIAVGMAGKIPQHNLGEVIDASVAYLKNPKISLKSIMKVLPGPDFGGIIANPEELSEIYATGQGKLRVRGEAAIFSEKGHPVIKITSVPPSYVGGVSRFLTKIGELYKAKVLSDISDISNMTAKDVDIRIFLKKDADPQKTLNLLFKKAGLEETVGISMLAVKDNKADLYPLLDIFGAYREFVLETQKTKYEYLLKKAMGRQEVLDGLLGAIDQVDAVIAAIRGAKTKDVVRKCLMTGDISEITFRDKSLAKIASGFCFTENQTDAILAMPLARLIGLEIKKLLEEKKQVEEDIKKYRTLTSDEVALSADIIKELKNIKKTFAVPRKTELVSLDAVVLQKEEIKEIPVTLSVDRFGYLKVTESDIPDMKYSYTTTNLDRALLFTNLGNVYQLKLSELPLSKAKDKGSPVETLCGFGEGEYLVYVSTLGVGGELLFVSTDGFIKRVNLREFDTNRRCAIATKLNAGAEVVYVGDFAGNISMATENGQFIRMSSGEVPEYKKSAIGCKGMTLAPKDKILVVSGKDFIQYQGENLPVTRIKLSRRGGKGVKLRL